MYSQFHVKHVLKFPALNEHEKRDWKEFLEFEGKTFQKSENFEKIGVKNEVT